MEITQDLVKDYFEYKDGGLYWKRYRRGSQLGKRFGSYDGRYRVGSFFGKRCYEHRLIWLYHCGVWPKDQIDHIDRDKSNNKIENLRQATTFTNSQNVKLNSSSKQTGVGFHKRSKRWRARSCLNGKRVEIGRFKTEQEAINAYENFNKYRL